MLKLEIRKFVTVARRSISPLLCNTQSTATLQASQPMRLSQIPLLASSPLQNGYLEASRHGRQPLCGSSEGWGPLSPVRYDFTPCFLDVWIAVVAAAGIIGGGGALWYLYGNCTAQPVKKNWHFYAKLVGTFLPPISFRSPKISADKSANAIDYHRSAYRHDGVASSPTDRILQRHMGW
jgi:hypothetical protein